MSEAASRFDNRTFQWNPLGDLEHFEICVLSVDEERNIADFLGRFPANEKIVLHRHLADTHTFVVEGEHILYEPGTQAQREVRPVGRHTFSPAGDAHHEGGGDTGCVIYYSVRGETDALFDLLDDDGNVAATLRTADLKAALEVQASG